MLGKYIFKEEKGVSAIEYAVIAALIALVLIVYRQGLIDSSQSFYDQRKDTFNYLNKQPLIVATPTPAP